jgi:hypothetical protein
VARAFAILNLCACRQLPAIIEITRCHARNSPATLGIDTWIVLFSAVLTRAVFFMLTKIFHVIKA